MFGWVKNEGTVCGGRCAPGAEGIHSLTTYAFSRYAWIQLAAGALGALAAFHSPPHT